MRPGPKYFHDVLAARTHQIVASLDIHEKSIYVFILYVATGEILYDANITGGFKPILRCLKRHIKSKRKAVILFEAGGFGYYPYRLFTKHGYECKMIAPHSIPDRKRPKHDRADAMDNLKDHLAGQLRYVYVPTVEDVELRESLRHRFRVQWHLTKQKQQILALLKRHGMKYEGTKTNWTKLHWIWLRNLELSAALRNTLDLYLEQTDLLVGQLERLDEFLDRMFAQNPRYARESALYRCLPGVGRIGAMVFVLEVGCMERFRHPKMVMSYGGVVPDIQQSGDKNPSLSITKVGNRFFRIHAVRMARQYSDHRSLHRHKQLQAMPPVLREFVMRAQARLHTRYRHLVGRHKPSNKAAVAVAREACGYLWELMVKIKPQLENQGFKEAA
jgi:transposase